MASQRKKKDGDEPEPVLCPYVKFTTPDGSPPPSIHRRQIQGAPYNPRKISDDSRRRLRDNLKRVGLVNALVWNRRTGNLVSGHQRLSILDALMRTDNYLLPVDVVDLDEVAEKEQNLFLNNPDAQGMWDLERVEAILKEGQVNLDHVAFDVSATAAIFGSEILEGQSSEVLQEIADKLRASGEAYNKIMKAGVEKHNIDYYRVVIFADWNAAQALNEAMGLEGIFLPGDHLMARLNGDGDGGEAAGTTGS